MNQVTMYLAVSVLSITAGFALGLWWNHPDIKSLKNKIRFLEEENTRQRKYILRDFKVRVVRNGVEVDPDE